MSDENDIWISDVYRIRSLLAANDTVETIDQSSNQHFHTAYLYLGLYSVLGVTGICLNAIMIVIYTRGKRKLLNKMVSNRFNLNLVIAHLLQVRAPEEYHPGMEQPLWEHGMEV